MPNQSEINCDHLKKNVQIWDVAAERQVEISGPDSAKLVQLMTCRDLSKSKIGRCYYCPIIDDNGNLVNDPVILKLAEDKWWISIADSDVIFFAKGLASGNNFKVKIFFARFRDYAFFKIENFIFCTKRKIKKR